MVVPIWLKSSKSIRSGKNARRRSSQASKSHTKRRRSYLELLEDRRLLTANVVTNQLDFAPGATAHIFASDFALGEAVQFQVLHNDGTPNTGGGHQPWQVTDGVRGDFNNDGVMDGDLDGVVDGNIHTTWYVNPDDSYGSSFDLSALGLNSGLFAATTFTDAVQTDQFYSPGEGLGAVTIKAVSVADGTTYTVQTLASGGYSLALPAGAAGGVKDNITAEDLTKNLDEKPPRK